MCGDNYTVPQEWYDSDKPGNYTDLFESDDWDVVEPETDNLDDYIGIGTFGTEHEESVESDIYRRTLQAEQFGYLV